MHLRSSRLRSSLTEVIGAVFAASLGGLAGWWWQSRSREAALEEQTRRRLRRWTLR